MDSSSLLKHFVSGHCVYSNKTHDPIQHKKSNSGNLWLDPTQPKPPLNNFGLIQYQDEASQLSQSVYFVATKGSKFQEEEVSHKCSTSAFVRLLLLQLLLSSYQEPHFWRTEGQELLHLCVTENSCLNPLQCMIQEHIRMGSQTLSSWYNSSCPVLCALDDLI